MLLLPSKASNLLASRRSLLTGSGRAVLSATAVGLLVGCTAKAGTMQTADTSKSDVDILNTALALEYEGIAAYQVGAESGLLTKPVLAVAVKFQDHHKKHADVLASTVKKLGGTPVTAKAKYDFPTGNLKTQEDVLRFAAGLEQGAAQAYYGAVPVFTNKDLSSAAASIMADEAMHWAVLRSVLGEDPVPNAFAIS